MHVRLLSTLLIGAILAAWSAPAPAMAQAGPGRSDFGVNSHIASRYPVQAGFDAPVNLLAGTSAGWAREDFHWYWLEPQSGRFDWSIYDRAISRLASSGVNIIGVLNTAPAWATPFGGDAAGRPSYYAPDPAAFARFASAVVTRYRDRVRYWQVWNEPENARYWQPQPDPAAYAALLRAVYPAIKAADPNATVLSAGVVPTSIGFIRAIAANGAWDSFDVLAVHPYVDPFGPENGQIGAGDVSAVRTLVESLGRKPIWATEFGWSTGPADRDPRGVDEETQASYLVRAAVLLRSAGVEKVIWYKLKDTEQRDGQPFNTYGLLRSAGGPADLSQPKPALAAFRALNQQLANATPVGLLDLGARQVVTDFENFGSWRRGDQPNGTFVADGSQRRSGGVAGRLDYRFPSEGNDYVVFTPRPGLPIPGAPGQLGVWVYGDGSGHALKVWLRDAEGETLQFRLGFVGGSGWSFLSAPINGQVEAYNRISGGGNLRLDFPATLTAIVLDDEPDNRSGSGSIWLDDLTALSGPEVYGVRFARGNDTIDVLWAPGGAFINLPTTLPQGTLADRSGSVSRVDAANGAYPLNLGPAPIFVTHRAAGVVPEPQPAPPPPQPAAGPCRQFSETGFAVCGRLLEYWERNGGLAVFGFPIGPEEDLTIEGKTVRAQWFERNRLELHPEQPAPYDVLLGRLGAERLAASGRNWPDFPKSDPGAQYYFPQTGQAIAPEFRQYWASRGLDLDGRPGFSPEESLALFGLPLSPALMEVNPSDGRSYLTQHFERARFEYHPENLGTPYVVLLGLLGREVTGRR